MRLSYLEPKFLSLESENVYRTHDNIAEAQGICFICPGCFIKNGGPVGTHSIICWFNNRGVPPDKSPGPGRWNPSGTGYEDLTFVGPGATSVLELGGCGVHFLVENGEIKIS
jgi:hypothetical protein